MRNVSIVLGLVFGDEGKGRVVNWLCPQKKNPLVVRFNGGHQAGHTVVRDGVRHVFSNFGSGSLQDVPTYWSEYCTVDPVGFANELKVLKQLGVKPTIYYNKNAMVTTPYDIWANKNNNLLIRNGSVGVGFGQTIQRNEDHFRLSITDLFYPRIRDEKLRLIRDAYYKCKYARIKINEFKECCDYLMTNSYIVNGISDILYNDLIFEGAQGIMLDQRYGFFPHVTRSNTTSVNALKILGSGKKSVETYYVTRAYQTRHGNGPMTTENIGLGKIKINPNETNKKNIQGKFRRGILDLDMMSYAIGCDVDYPSKRAIVVNCLDHVEDPFQAVVNRKVIKIEKNFLSGYLFNMFNVDTVFMSFSDK